MLAQCLGEFLGTLMLIILGDGVVATVLLKQSKGYGAGWLAITAGWFVAVVMGVLVAQSTGSANADINPAISFAKYCVNWYSWKQFVLFSLSQILGAFLGAVIVWLAYLPHWKITEDSSYKLMIFCTMPAIRIYRYNFLCEAIATMILLIGVYAIFGKATLGHPAVGLGPYLVGILVWGIGLSLGGPTGYAINPARDLGPRLAHALLPIPEKGSSDWSYAWIPFLAPFVGAIFGVAILYLIHLVQ